jgi:dolichol-phosphate mannosyltransferase
MCAECIPILLARLSTVLEQITENYEIIFVDDFSPDNSWGIIKLSAENDSRVKGIRLSRNFGQHYAISAGIDASNGDWVVVMDCDLQDQPEEIPKLYSYALKGYQQVIGKRLVRQDTPFKKMSSKLFFIILSFLLGNKVNSQIGNFGIYSRKVIDAIVSLREQSRSFGLLAIWVGFPRIEVDVTHAKREIGSSSYSLNRMINLAIDSIVSNSSRLLVLTIKMGFLIAFFAFLAAIVLIVGFMKNPNNLSGWTSLIVSLFLATGLFIFTLGIVGIYVGKIFDQVKERPLYVVNETTF